MMGGIVWDLPAAKNLVKIYSNIFKKIFQIILTLTPNL